MPPAAARGVLAAHGIRADGGRGDRPQAAHHLGLLVAHLVRLEQVRRLHRHQRDQLQHVVLHHVAQRAGLVVITRAAFEADGLRHRDLHVVDRRCVPQRLEQRVREPQREQVLHRLFAEVVVDAEDAIFVEDLAHGLVDLDARGVVVTDRLLEHDAAVLAGESRGGEAQARRPIELRRSRHEIENAVVARRAPSAAPRCPWRCRHRPRTERR